VSSLYVVREAGAQQREVAKALLTYSNPEADTIGPALELIEVKERWRGKGLGRRLMQVGGSRCRMQHCISLGTRFKSRCGRVAGADAWCRWGCAFVCGTMARYTLQQPQLSKQNP
jgi:GNAT superfamily N-acetyltransferase